MSGKQKQKRQEAPTAVGSQTSGAPLHGTGGIQLSHHEPLLAVSLPVDIVRRIHSFVAACRSLPPASAASLSLASALSSLPAAALLQQQADSLQQVLAVCAAYGLVAGQQSGTLSSTSRKQLQSLLPPSEHRAAVVGEARQQLRDELLDALLPLMLAGLRFPRAVLSPLLSLLDGLGASPQAVDAAAESFLGRLALTSTTGLAGMDEVSVIEVALEWPPLAACLARHCHTILSAFIQLTQAVAAQLTESSQAEQQQQQQPASPSPTGAATSADLVDISASELDDSAAASAVQSSAPADSDSEVVRFLRVFVQFATRCRAAVYEWTGDDSQRPQLASLLASLIVILHSSVVGKDPVTQSALLVVLLIQNPAVAAADRLTLCHQLFFAPVPASPCSSASSTAASTSSSAAWLSSLAALRHPVWSALAELHRSSRLSHQWFASCSPTARLAVYRAVLTQSPPSLLCQPVLLTESASSSSSSSSAGPHSAPPLLYSVFPLLLSDCWSSSPQLRYYALHCLEVWCGTVELAMQSSADASVHSLSLPDCLSRLLGVLSVNWEHPYRVITGVAKQLFSHFVRLSALLARPGQPDLVSFARPLLSACLSHHDRGAYQQLNILAPHVGALVLLRHCPALIAHGMTAARYQPIWGVVGGMLQRLLTLARHELTEAHNHSTSAPAGQASTAAVLSAAHLSKRGKMRVKEKQRVVRLEAVVRAGQDDSADGTAEWRRLWVEPVASSLLSDDEQTRQAVCTSLVAVLLKLDPPSFAPLLAAVQSSPDNDAASGELSSAAGLSFRHLRALLCVLTTARRIGLVSSHQLHEWLLADQRAVGELPVSRSILLSCLVHADAGLRLECAELVCSNLYMAELPSVSELQLLTHALPYLVQIEEPALRARFLKSGLQRLFIRMRDAINKAVKQDTAAHSAGQQQQQTAAGGDGADTAGPSYPFDARSRSSLSSTTLTLLSPSLSFLRWLSHFLIDCQYPAAAYERHCAALEMLRLMIACFSLEHDQEHHQHQHSAGDSGDGAGGIDTSAASLESHLVRHAVLIPLLTASSALVLLAGVGRAWQAVRFLSYSILVSAFPSPLPGFTSVPAVRRLLEWALALSSSPRARDSEAGALAIKLVFIKYVKQLRWSVPLQQIAQAMQQDGVHDQGVSSEWRLSSSSASAVFSFLCSIRALLVSQLALLRSTPLSSRYTAAHARLHGVVRLFRLVVEEVQYDGWDESDERRRGWASLVADMLALLEDIALVSLKLHVPKQAHRVMQAASTADKAGRTADTARLVDATSGSHGAQQPHRLDPPLDGSRGAELNEQVEVQEDEQEAGYGQEADEGDDSEGEGEGEGEGDDADTDVASVDCRGHVVLAGSQSLDGSSAHLIVVASWLTIKEVCLLLGAWVNTCPLSLSRAEAEAEAHGDHTSAATSGVSLLSVRDVQRIGAVFLSVLVHSKHNGVLENAHLGLLRVCERLLSSDEVAQRLVAGWLDELMWRISAADDDSWLRRSRGIAFALLAILKAQPSHRPPVLLSQAMTAIMKQASKAASTAASSADDSLQEWRSAVHGLNLLRSLFRDSTLHVACLPYVTAALEASVGGFSHPVWAVRNSALISFAPIALKAIRAQYNQQLKQQSGLTAHELFSLYPELSPFLLGQLGQASGATDAATPIHPTLYPLMMILSRLRASHSATAAAAAGEQRTADVQPFLDAVHGLAGHPHHQARQMAARALVALTDTEQQQTAMVDLAQRLPCNASRGWDGERDWNGIDGRLQQLTALFDAWRSPHRDGRSGSGWLQSFIEQLQSCEWLGSAAVPIPATRVTYLSLLTSAVLSLPAHHSCRSLVRLGGCLAALAACCEPPVPTSFAGVGSARMRSQAASLLLRLLLSVTETVDATPLCLSLLSDRDVGVRHAVLQTVLFVAPLGPLTARLNLAAVHSSLCASLAGLSHPSTLAVALRLLSVLNEQLSTTESDAACAGSLAEPALWSLLLAAAGSDNVEVQAAALPCLGRAVRAVIGSFLQLAAAPSAAALHHVLSRCVDWLARLSDCCDDLRVPAVRHAVWRSINQSGCIQAATQPPAPPHSHAQLSLQPAIAVTPSTVPASSSWPSGPWYVGSLSDVRLWLWQLLFRLMCDESAAIRDDAAALAHVALDHWDAAASAALHLTHNHTLSPPLPSTLLASSRTRLPAVSVASAVLERSIARFASTFNSEQAIAFMLQLFAAAQPSHVFCCIDEVSQLFDVSCALDSSSAHFAGAVVAPSTVHGGDALFAAERANHVLEAAHLMSLSAHALSVQLPLWLAASPSAREVVHAWLFVQCSLCVRCLAGLCSLLASPQPAPVSSTSTSAAAVADSAPVNLAAPHIGGVAFAEADFLRLYGCLLLTRLLLDTHTTEDEQGGREAEDGQRRRKEAKDAVCAAARSVLCSPNAALLHPVLLRLCRLVAGEAGGRDKVTFALLSGAVPASSTSLLV